MELERVALFLDHTNLDGSFKELGTDVDYVGLRDYLVAGRVLVDAYIYVSLHPDRRQASERFVEHLAHEGFFVRTKSGKRTDVRWKPDIGIELAVDALRFAHAGNVDIIVIGSGDGDLAPLARELRTLGIRCEIAATPATVARELRQEAGGFIDLGKEVIRGGGDETSAPLNGHQRSSNGSRRVRFSLADFENEFNLERGDS